MHDFKYVDNMEQKIIITLLLTSSLLVSFLVFTPWKWGETSSTISLLLIRTSSN